MTSDERGLHPLAEDYLRRLERAARELPADRRNELITEVRRHLVEAIPADASDSDALEAIERLGLPEEIVDADDSARVARMDRRGLREWSAVFLLLLGGFVFGIGWIAGLILLWSSRLWTTRDKLIGTLIIPGGLAGAVVLLATTALAHVSTQICSRVITQLGPAAPGKSTVFAGPGSARCVTTGQHSAQVTVLEIVLIAVLMLAPIASAIYLARRAGRNSLPA